MERTRPPQQLTAEETHEVLKRAAQLEQRPAAPGEPSLDLAEVERIGLEAGLSKEAIQRAFVELRAGALKQPAAPTLADRLMGPAMVEVQRPIALPVEEARRRLHAALKAELLHPAERQGNRTVWSAAPGLWASIQRGLNFHGQSQWREGEVISDVTEAPPGIDAQSVVRVEAGPGQRSALLFGSLVPGLLMLAMAVATSIAPGPPPEVPFVFLGTGAFASGLALTMSRGVYRKRLRNVRQAIERVLDRLTADPEDR